jgi:hypothetical protein
MKKQTNIKSDGDKKPAETNNGGHVQTAVRRRFPLSRLMSGIDHPTLWEAGVLNPPPQRHLSRQVFRIIEAVAAIIV